ncbi:MAG: class I SAM-dependent methyltransferase [Ignavibacteriae bacterium]|nr:class I SAM-dependent methyltransferase [Ignavibacteriota bacterium]
MKILIRKIFDSLGYDIRKKKREADRISTKKAEDFPEWLRQADESGSDVNDYICSKMGSPLPTLEKFVFPYLRKIKDPVFCEIGTGTGRWSRDIAGELRKHNEWKLYLIDHSPWIINFLVKYFEKESNIIPLLNDGKSLPVKEDLSIDMVFSTGTFIEFNLQTIYSYCCEFKRLIKKNGYAIFNYFDIDTEVAFNHMKGQRERSNSCFSYHSNAAIDKIFNEAGFELILRQVYGESSYVVYRKSDD